MIRKQRNGSKIIQDDESIKNEFANIIIINLEQPNTFSGGDVHIDYLAKIYSQVYHFNVMWDIIKGPFKQFNAFSNVVALIKALLKPVNYKYRNLGSNTIVIAPNPYPFSIIRAVKISRSINGQPVVFFHHLSLSFKFCFRRGFVRTSINYFLNLGELAFCKILKIPIFIDNAKYYHLKGIEKYEDYGPFDHSAKSSNSQIEKKYDLCYVGRFQKHKGAIDLIHVVKNLKDSNMQVKIAVIGKVDIKFKKKVVKLLRKYNIEENFSFFGWIDNLQKIDILLSSKIYVHLSYEEGWSLSVMDAAYMGIPVVAYDLPAYSYMAKKYNSVPVGDIMAATSTVKKVLLNYPDALMLAEEARKAVSMYNYSDIARYHIESYKEIIRERRDVNSLENIF